MQATLVLFERDRAYAEDLSAASMFVLQLAPTGSGVSQYMADHLPRVVADVHRAPPLQVDGMTLWAGTVGSVRVIRIEAPDSSGRDRVYRVFVVYGLGSEQTVQRFRGALLVFLAARIASFAYLALFLAGVVICAWRRRLPMILLAPPVCIALTISPYLTNMRYSMTTQACLLILAAVALLAMADAIGGTRTGDPANRGVA